MRIRLIAYRDGWPLPLGVALILHDLEVLLFMLQQRETDLPRSGKHFRVFDGCLVRNGIRARASETLDHMKSIAVVVTRRIQPSLIVEVGRVHHKGVAIPVSDRIAHPKLDIRKMLLPPEINVPHRANILRKDGKLRWPLSDLEWIGGVHEPRDSRHETLVHGICRGGRLFILQPPSPRLRQIGNLTIGGIDNNAFPVTFQFETLVNANRRLPDSIEVWRTIGEVSWHIGLRWTLRQNRQSD